MSSYGGTYAQKDSTFEFASEADLLNVDLFDVTVRQWHKENYDVKGSMRDHANVYQLTLSQMYVLVKNEFVKYLSLNKKGELQ